jgi:hypothetical protein
VNTEQAINPIKMWWPGDKSVEPFMPPVAEAISRHLPSGDAWTDIYNRAYEAVYSALRAQQDRENPKPLTLAQLKERVGKPVWVRYRDGIGCCWGIVEFTGALHIKTRYKIISLLDLQHSLGKYFNLYDHQPTV